VAARSKAWTAFARSNTAIVGSNPTWGMDVCARLFCICPVLCVQVDVSGRADPLSTESYRLCKRPRNWKAVKVRAVEPYKKKIKISSDGIRLVVILWRFIPITDYLHQCNVEQRPFSEVYLMCLRTTFRDKSQHSRNIKQQITFGYFWNYILLHDWAY
jgi:hypothetical protein